MNIRIWQTLIIAIAIIIAVVLALYVIMPKIAQGLMNKATIEFSAIVSVF